jgi:hypothetical protein
VVWGQACPTNTEEMKRKRREDECEQEKEKSSRRRSPWIFGSKASNDDLRPFCHALCMIVVKDVRSYTGTNETDPLRL